MKNKISVIMRFVISFGLLALLFWIMRNDIRNIWATISRSSLHFIVIAVVFILINATMLSYRLKVIFLGENLQITLGEAVQLTFMGYFFNNFMPTAVGGDIIKAHYAAELNQKRIQSYASVLMDRFIGLYSFLVVAAVALVIDRGRFQMAVIRPLVFCLLAAGLAGFIIATNKTVARFIERFFMRLKMLRLGERLMAAYNIVHDYRNRRDVVAKSFLVSLFAQCLYFGVVYLFFLSLGTRVSLGNICLIMPVVTFISMIPSLGGLGVREGAMVAFFAPLVGKDTAFAVSLLSLFGLFLISIIGGVIYLWWGFSRARKERHQ
ncbi:MAG: lysylphosphatidylglycerol synthase transmembrane domain-containing protein [Candidatus Omnitrophota bacterium]